MFLCCGENCVGNPRFLYLYMVYDASGNRDPVEGKKRGRFGHVLVPGVTMVLVPR